MLHRLTCSQMLGHLVPDAVHLRPTHHVCLVPRKVMLASCRRPQGPGWRPILCAPCVEPVSDSPQPDIPGKNQARTAIPITIIAGNHYRSACNRERQWLLSDGTSEACRDCEAQGDPRVCTYRCALPSTSASVRPAHRWDGSPVVQSVRRRSTYEERSPTISCAAVAHVSGWVCA